MRMRWRLLAHETATVTEASLEERQGPRLAPDQSRAMPRTWPRPFDAVTIYSLMVALVSRTALFLTVWLSLRTFPRFPLYRDQAPDSLLPEHPMLDGWARWDAVHYGAIAAHGYPNGSGVAFFPVFPLLVRAVAIATGTPRTP